MKKLLLLVLLTMAIVGCGEPVFDGSSYKSFLYSAKVVMDSCTDDQKKKVDKAIMQLVYSKMDALRSSQPKEISADVFEVVNGLTAQEVIDLAERMKKQ